MDYFGYHRNNLCQTWRIVYEFILWQITELTHEIKKVYYRAVPLDRELINFSVFDIETDQRNNNIGGDHYYS